MLADESVMVASDPASSIRLALAAKYEVIEEIGRGGMAVVYKAIQKNLDRVIALKVLPRHLIFEKEFLDRFHQEARSSAKLNHPNIITIHDEGNEGGIHFIAMEFLDGINLHQMVKLNGRLETSQVVEIIIPIAKALEFAHNNGYVHRDVKSSNIIITKEGRIVLTDFGIVQVGFGQSPSSDHSVLGTPEFMSPEQAAGKPVDNRTDIYGLGVIMYHALSGKYPYHSDTPLMTIHQIIREPHPPIDEIVNVPPWLRDIVEGCLRKDLSQRIQSAGEVIDALQPESEFETKPTKEKSLPQISGSTLKKSQSPTTHLGNASEDKLPRRKKTWVLWVLVGVFLVMGGLATMIWFHVTPPPVKIEATVPSVVGLTYDSAKLEIEHVHLSVGNVVQHSGTAEQRNRVVLQKPMPGASLGQGSAVDLTVVNEVEILMPNLIGYSEDSAKAYLSKLQLIVGQTIEADKGSEWRRKVFKQQPTFNEKLRPGASVTLHVGL